MCRWQGRQLRDARRGPVRHGHGTGAEVPHTQAGVAAVGIGVVQHEVERVDAGDESASELEVEQLAEIAGGGVPGAVAVEHDVQTRVVAGPLAQQHGLARIEVAQVKLGPVGVVAPGGLVSHEARPDPNRGFAVGQPRAGDNREALRVLGNRLVGVAVRVDDDPVVQIDVVVE